MKKTIKINGKDFTEYFTPTGYSVSYKKIRGPNSGYMQDGSYTDDVLAVKAIVTCTCMPLDETKLSTLLSEISGAYADVIFFDPAMNEYRTAKMLTPEPSQKFKGTGADSVDYWTGTILQFTEK